jgi:hypothetical protein
VKRLTVKRLVAVMLVILSGLALRKIDFGLPFFIWKYGGSLLWATMVYLLCALAMRARPSFKVLLVAALISLCVEFSRLLDIEWLNQFRKTTVGALTLGAIFSLWNLPAYAAGVLAGWGLDLALLKRPPDESADKIRKLEKSSSA